jgi:hypothetical protein
MKGGRRISWVKWSVVCKERKKGGLGVRDIRIVNLSLLAKWRWRIILPGRPLWKEVLIAKYGDQIIHQVEWANISFPSIVSSWWRSIMGLDKVVVGKNWLMEVIRRKMGNGASTLFWSSKWIGEVPLAVAFPRLFSLSNQKDCTVANLVVSEGENRSWNFSWRRTLFQWEEDLVLRLNEVVGLANFSVEEDRWLWVPEDSGVFTVKSAYNFLLKEIRSDDEVDGVLVNALEQIWDSPAPSKVIAFSWQLIYDRILTRLNLQVRGIVVTENPWECLGCVGKVESSTHLFLHCPCAMMIWSSIFNWLGVEIVIPHSISSLFEVFRGIARNAKIQKGFLMIWHATLWSIWKARNKAIFSTGSFLPNVIVDDIKVLSWKWSLGRLRISPCLFYEWLWDPGACLVG